MRKGIWPASTFRNWGARRGRSLRRKRRHAVTRGRRPSCARAPIALAARTQVLLHVVRSATMVRSFEDAKLACRDSRRALGGILGSQGSSRRITRQRRATGISPYDRRAAENTISNARFTKWYPKPPSTASGSYSRYALSASAARDPSTSLPYGRFRSRMTAWRTPPVAF